MRAVVVREPGGPEVLELEERPIPEARPGWVLTRVHAFGLNRSELTTRAGGSGDAVEFPRVLGIECVGEVVEAPDGDLQTGQIVVAAMGGLGRDYDGGYQQYILLPASQAIPVQTSLDWSQLGAVPESVGMAAITIAKDRGLTVIATTRQQRKRAALERQGADHAIVVDGPIAPTVRGVAPAGVDGLCELVGPTALVEALPAVADGGSACMVGFLEGNWDTSEAEAEAQRLGIPLRRFGSGAINRDSYGEIFQRIVDAVQEGRYRIGLDRTFRMDEIADAHRYMEENRAAGKVVVLSADE